MRRTSIQWLFLQFSRLTPGPRHWGNVGGHDNGTLCRIPLILWRRHSCRINIQQCIPEFLSTPLLPSETQDEIFPGRLDMLIHMVFFYIFECFSELVYFALNNRKIYLQNGWSVVQIFLINSYSYNYIILIPLFFYRKSHSRRQVQHRVRDMQDRCQSKG